MKVEDSITSLARKLDGVGQSPERRQEPRGGSEDRSAVDDAETGGDVDDAEQSEEKLKVVVRVRPLQKNEQPWSTLQHEGDDGDDDDYAALGGVRRAQPPGGTNSTATTTVPTAPVESALAIHRNSVSWDKNGQTKILLADAVFDGNATQTEVFHSVEDCIDGLFAGFDCSVFAYGQTGTGKTHTMSGLPHNARGFDVDEDDEDASASEMDPSLGVVPRCIQKLFEEIEQQRASEGPSVSFALYCSFVEIYNERIYDILSSDMGVTTTPSQAGHATPRHPRAVDNRAGWNRAQPSKEAPSLQIRQKLDGSVFVDGLTSRRISSRAEMLRAFREGSMNREVRDNLYNQHSSRGHSVFQVTLRKNVTTSGSGASRGNSSPRSSNSTSPKRPPSTSSNKPSSAAPPSSKSRLSRLFFVDLAGSEKWHVNGSDLSDKYATELSSINKSLSALTNCVLALTQKERTHVPFRDSVLTRLLQSCLQGQGRTAFIVTISPSRDSLEESFATLRFAERLKALRCRPIRRKIFANELVMGEQRVYYEKQIHSMRLEVTRLRDLLKKAQRRNQEIAESTAAAANVALIEENCRLKELLMHSERNRLVERSERQTNPKNAKLSSVSGSSVIDASPQRQAAKQILASIPRPFSEEEASPKSISGASSSPSGASQDAPTTPQPRRSNGRERDTSRHEDKKTVGDEEKQYSTLVNSLQDKEAHLNWMLEAELEAQNTRGQVLPAITSNSQSNGVVQGTAANGKPTGTVTRSWAVERALRRNLVAVPTPVRGGSTTSTANASTASTNASQASAIAAPTSTKPPTVQPSEPNNVSLVRQRPAYTASDQTPSTKTDSPRQPVRVVATSTSHELSSSAHKPLQGRQPASTLTAKTNYSHQAATQEEAPVKSASILKLVGSTTADKLGKSKDELVDEYKRARRAELEAMLRTMVHR